MGRPIENYIEFKEKSSIISNLIEIRGGKEESLWNEIEKRRRILEKNVFIRKTLKGLFQSLAL